jgi:hypothetical protein
MLTLTFAPSQAYSATLQCAQLGKSLAPFFLSLFADVVSATRFRAQPLFELDCCGPAAARHLRGLDRSATGRLVRRWTRCVTASSILQCLHASSTASELHNLFYSTARADQLCPIIWRMFSWRNIASSCQQGRASSRFMYCPGMIARFSIDLLHRPSFSLSLPISSMPDTNPSLCSQRKSPWHHPSAWLYPSHPRLPLHRSTYDTFAPSGVTSPASSRNTSASPSASKWSPTRATNVFTG